MNRKQKLKWFIVAVMSLLIISLSIGYLISIGFQKLKGRELYRNVESNAPKIENSQSSAHQDSVQKQIRETEVTSETEVISETEMVLDIEEIRKTMPDTYAWIEIPGTNINYPIVQHKTDNTFYLDHTADLKENKMGAIFTEDLNKKDFNDPNTLIYGHNIKDGSLFGQLHYFEDKEFFQNHSDVYIYTQDRILKYRIFAAYLTDNKHILKNHDFSVESIYELYLKDVFAIRNMDSNIDKEVSVTGKNKIITLSTCHSAGKDYRYLVQAVLIEQ